MDLFGWLTRRREITGPGSQCQWCGAAVTDGMAHAALVADDSVTRPVPLLNGRRLVTACSLTHLTALTSQPDTINGGDPA